MHADSDEPRRDRESSAGDPPLETVRRAQLGDAEAFEAVYHACVERVFALCLRICADRVRAEELTQDVFVRAWRKLRSFRGDSRFSTWLHRLAVNVAVDSMRSDRRRGARFVLGIDRDVVSRTPAGPFPEDPAERVTARVQLERAVASLPPGARTVLVLRDIEGLEYKEVARVTGLALGTVKAQLFRARRLLRERVER